MSDEIDVWAKIRNWQPNDCFPQLHRDVTVSWNPRRGRHIIARADIPMGQVVCVEKGVTVSIQKDRCYFCLSPSLENSRFCKKCDLAFEESHEPAELPNGAFDDLGMFKLAAHVVLTYPFEDIMAVLSVGTPKDAPRAPTRLKTSDFCSIVQLQAMAGVAQTLCAPEILPRVRRFADLLSAHPNWGKLEPDERFEKFFDALRLVAERCARNAHTIYTIEQTAQMDEDVPLGTGMFPISSIFNHSCTPNVFSFFIRDTFVFVSRGVVADEELTDSYGVTYDQDSLETRKEFLRTHSGFECHCPSCSNATWIDELQTPQIEDLEAAVRMSRSIDDLVSYQKSLKPGHKDIERVIQLFAVKPEVVASPDALMSLWSLFLANAETRHIKFDPYQLNAYLELVVAGHHRAMLMKDDALKKLRESRWAAIFCAYEIVHCFYADLHPAHEPLAALLGWQSDAMDNVESASTYVAAVDQLRVLLDTMRPNRGA